MAINTITECKRFDIELKRYESDSVLREGEFYFVNGNESQKVLSEVEIGNNLWSVFMEHQEMKPNYFTQCQDDQFYNIFFLIEVSPPLAFGEFAALEIDSESSISVYPPCFNIKRQCHDNAGPYKIEMMINVIDQFNKSEFGKLTLTIKTGKSDDSDLFINFFKENQIDPASLIKHVGGSNRLFQNSKFSDVTLKVQGKELHVHKFVLDIASSVFETMFDSDFRESRNNVVEIQDFEFEVIQELVKYIYTHKSPQFQSSKSKFDTISLYKASHRYEIIPLLGLCRNELLKTLNIDNALDILLLADVYEESFLKKAALDLVCKNPPRLDDMSKYDRIEQQRPGLMKDIVTCKFAQSCI